MGKKKQTQQTTKNMNLEHVTLEHNEIHLLP